MRKAARPHAIREVSGPETRVSLGVALYACIYAGDVYEAFLLCVGTVLVHGSHHSVYYLGHSFILYLI